MRFIQRMINNNILNGVVNFVLFHLDIIGFGVYISFWRKQTKRRSICLYSKSEDLFVSYEYGYWLYWDLLPRMVNYHNSRSRRKKESSLVFFSFFKGGGGELILLQENQSENQGQPVKPHYGSCERNHYTVDSQFEKNVNEAKGKKYLKQSLAEAVLAANTSIRVKTGFLPAQVLFQQTAITTHAHENNR